jgi:hypothetical protein
MESRWKRRGMAYLLNYISIMEKKSWSEWRQYSEKENKKAEEERLKKEEAQKYTDKTKIENKEEKIEETLTYNGIKQTAPYSVSSLVLGILSLLLLNAVIGVILGFIGLYQANKGLLKYKQHPELYKGNGMLIAAKVLCLITVILFVLFAILILLMLLGFIMFNI